MTGCNGEQGSRFIPAGSKRENGQRRRRTESAFRVQRDQTDGSLAFIQFLFPVYKSTKCFAAGFGRGVTALHQGNNFIAEAASHDIFSQACGGGSAETAVTVKTGSDDRRIADTPRIFHKQPRRGCAAYHAALLIQCQDAYGVVPLVG